MCQAVRDLADTARSDHRAGGSRPSRVSLKETSPGGVDRRGGARSGRLLFGGPLSVRESNPVLVRAQASFFAQFVAEWSFTVAIGLVAYLHGGAFAVGVVGLVRLGPAGLLGPLVAAYGDRIPRDRLLLILATVRGLATLGIGAVLYAGSGMLPVYLLAAASQIAFTPYRGTHSALLPLLCRTPEQLMSVNVVRGGLDSLSIVLGPLIAAGLVAVTDVAAVFVFAGACSLVSAAMLVGLSYERVVPAHHRVVREMGEGLRRVATTPGLRLIVALMALQTAIRGAYTVIVVVVAIDLLDRADSVVGVLQASLGVGALVGAVLCGRLVGSTAMARWLGVGIVLWSLPLAALGLLPTYVVALLASAVIGGGKALVDLAAFTMIPRLTPDAVLARVFGALESVIALSVGAASLLTPLLIDAVGTEHALIIIGVAPCALVLMAWPALGRIDHSVHVRTGEMRLLRRVNILRPLPVPVLERLVRQMHRVSYEAGQTIFEAGAPGDVFLVIASGSVEIRDGEETVRILPAGAGFGEIALLGQSRRTMTVVAFEDTVLAEIDRPDFLVAVSSFGDVSAAAQATRDRYLAHAPGLASA